MTNLKKISGVVGSGKTKQIIEKSDNDSLIVTLTHSLANDIKKRDANCVVINYHKLIWEMGLKIGMPLLPGKWEQYENEFIFEKNRDKISRKYSKIFIDFEDKERTEKWIKILEKYFLKDNGEIYLTSETQESISYRINGNIAEFIKNTLNKGIETDEKIDHRKKHIINYCAMANIETLNDLVKNNKFDGTTTILVYTKELQNNIESHISGLNSSKIQRKSFKVLKTKLNLTTIENFKGLESDNIILILTNDIDEESLYSSLTRAKKRLFILNFNDFRYRDKFKLFAEAIFGSDNNNPYKENLYISFLPYTIKDILKEFYPDKYINVKEIEHSHKKELETIFHHIFQENQELIFFNYDTSLVGITNSDTDIVLLVEESNNDNYFLCKKIIKNSNQFLLSEKNSIKVQSNLIYKIHSYEMKESKANINNNLIAVQDLILKVKQKDILKSISDTREYKKWETYIKIERQALEDEEKIVFEIELKRDKDKNNYIFFEKPKNIKVKIEKGSKIIISKDGAQIGKVKEIEKNRFYLVNVDINISKSLNTKIKKVKKHKIYICKQDELWIVDQLENGLNNIVHNDYKYYIFGDKKLSSIENWENIKVDFINKNLNIKQKEAIKKAIASKDMFLIQGPPGTGKTTVIAELSQYYLNNNQSVLITSESNDAIENAIERLNSDDLYPYIHQSLNRKEKTEDSNKILPIDLKLGQFYKERTINKLNNLVLNYQDNSEDIEYWELKKEDEIKKIDKSLKEALALNNPYIDKESIKEQAKQDKEKKIININLEVERLKKETLFIDIQKEFLRDLKDDIICNDEFKDSYEKRINIGGITLLSTATEKYRDVKYDVVIVDEISKSTPLQLNLALLKAKKVILIGDHKQLPPILSNTNESLREWAEELSSTMENKDGILNEILEELKENKTIFQKLIENNKENFVQLTTQYRMHSEIQNAINQFYETNLESGVDSKDRINKHKLFESRNLVWIDSSKSREKRDAKKSIYNQNEVLKIENILKKLNNEYQNINFEEIQKKPSIGVISFYTAQVDKLKNIYKNNSFENLNIDFGTVDSFQGQERDFIICSMVRSNDKKSIGFAKSLNRINVAFSRAKQLLIIVGNSKTFTQLTEEEHDSKSGKEIEIAKNKYKNIYNMAYKGEI